MRERSQVLPATVWTVGFHGTAFLLVLITLQRAAPAIAVLAVALLLALALAPIVSWLARSGVPRFAAVIAVIGALLAVAGTAVSLVVPLVAEQGRALMDALPDLVARLDAAFGSRRTGGGLLDRVLAEIRQNPRTAAGAAYGLLASALQALAAATTTVAVTVLLLVFGPAAFESGLRWARPDVREHYRDLGGRIRRAVGGYAAGTLIIALAGGAVTAVLTFALGVPWFASLGALTAVLGIVPYIGALVSGVLVVSTTFLSQGTWQGAVALAVFLAYQQLEGNVLQPVVQRWTIQMSPLVVATAVLVGIAAAGVLGGVLALPLAAALHVLAQDALDHRRARWSRDDAGRRTRVRDHAPAASDTSATHEDSGARAS